MVKSKEKQIDIALDSPKRRSDKRLARLLLSVVAVIAALVTATVCLCVGCVKLRAKTRAQQEQITALEQQLEEQKQTAVGTEDKNQKLEQENETLRDENDALKAEIEKMGLQFPLSAYEGKKLVALTFDDGPGKYTAELLDFFKEHRVRATFFLLGTGAAKYPDLVKRMDAEGHTVGNHSYNHATLTTLSAGGVDTQLSKCNAAIYKAIGRNARVMRCPGGSNNATVRKCASKADMALIHWSLDTLDWQLKDKDKILKRTFDEVGVQDGDIILLHDIHRESVDATKEMVLRLQKEGYTFVTVPELLAVRRGGAQAGTMYANGRS